MSVFKLCFESFQVAHEKFTKHNHFKEQIVQEFFTG